MSNKNSTNLFENELSVLKKARDFLATSENCNTVPKSEFEQLLKDYETLLQQSIQMNRVADLMSNGLNNMKNNLEERVNIDELTGLYNRRHLIVSMEKYIKEAVRNNSYLSVLFIDVDCFKKYNDSYGHVKGDECLKKIAEALLKSTLRAFDLVARYGGEEFFIILPYVDRNGAETVANRILNNVRNMQIEHLGNTAADVVTVSIGVTSYFMNSAAFSIDMGDFVKTSDEAMYQSKMSGRNRWTYLDIQK